MHVKTPSFIPNTFTSQTPYRMANAHCEPASGISQPGRDHQCCKVTHLMQACQTHSKCAVVPVHAVKACRGGKGTAPLILNLGD